MGKEEEALRNEVQDLHEQVLKHEVEQGGILRHLEEAEETIKTLKHKINVSQLEIKKFMSKFIVKIILPNVPFSSFCSESLTIYWF